MAKNKQQEVVNDEPTATDLDFGAIPAELQKQLHTVDPLQNLITFVPGKPGYTVGMNKNGYYVETKRVWSDKFLAGKKDKDGRIYRDLHILKHPTLGKFGIWSVGTLGFVMEKLAVGEYINIIYTGLAVESLKPGQSAPHTFKFEGLDGVALDPATMELNEMGRRDERGLGLNEANA